MSPRKEESRHMDDSVDLIGWEKSRCSPSLVSLADLQMWIIQELCLHVITERDSQSGSEVTPSAVVWHVTLSDDHIGKVSLKTSEHQVSCRKKYGGSSYEVFLLSSLSMSF